MLKENFDALDERIGQVGYTVLARVPNSGLPEFADGAWRVLAGSDPQNPNVVIDLAAPLASYILENDGDLVLYRLPTKPGAKAIPVLSRGAMSGRPPLVSTFPEYDPGLQARLEEARLASLAPPPAPYVFVAKPAKPDRRLASYVMAGMTSLFIMAMAFAATPGKTPFQGWVPDMNDPRDRALAAGAIEAVIPRQNDPEILDLWRIYPSADGKERRDMVATFLARDFKSVGGVIPRSPVAWRRPGPPDENGRATWN